MDESQKCRNVNNTKMKKLNKSCFGDSASLLFVKAVSGFHLCIINSSAFLGGHFRNKTFILNTNGTNNYSRLLSSTALTVTYSS